MAALIGLLLGASVVAAVPTAAGAAYATNGEPVWIPRNATNAGDALRADNRALVRIGSRVYLGGDFTELAPELGAPAIAQANLAAFDAVTGVPIESFAPRIDGKVYALVASDDGTTLYVGGSFSTVNGQPVKGFAVLDAATGALRQGITQRPVDGEVRALQKVGSTLYVGGQFFRFGGLSRKMLGRLDLSQPSLPVDPTWAPQVAGGLVSAIDVPSSGARVYAGGRFTSLDGVTVGKLVALDPITGRQDTTFAPLYTTTKQPVEDVEATDTRVFVAFGGGYNRFVQFSLTGNQDYASCGDGDVQEVHLVNGGTTMLVGGHFTGGPKRNCTLSTIPTPRIAQYDVTGPLPVPVTPTAFPNHYANLLGVWELLGSTLDDVWVAGDFMKMGSRNTGGLSHLVDGLTYTDGKVPTSPTGVQVTGATAGSLTVRWSPATDNKAVAGYYVVANGARRAVTTGTTATVAGLDPATAYAIQVQAFDAKLNLSALSETAPGTTAGDVTPPQAPTNVRVQSGSTTQLDLAWNAATDDGRVAGYQVYADGALLTTTAGLSATHAGLAPGSQHQYAVVAVDAAGNVSPASATLTARAYAVVLPAGSTWRYWDRGSLPDYAWREPVYDDSTWASGRSPLGYGRSYIATTIGFGPNANDRYLTSYARTTFDLPSADGVTGMTLDLRGTDGAAVFVNGRLASNDNLPAALEPDMTALTVRDTTAKDIVRELRVPVPAGMLVAGTNVVAVEFHKYAAGSTYLGFELALSAGLPYPLTTPPPPAPTGLSATAVAGPAVQLGWGAVAEAAQYRVLRDGSVLATVTDAAYSDATVTPGATYSYAVVAVDAAGRESSPSATASVTVPIVDTTAPTVPGKPVAGIVTTSSVALTWAPSTDNVGVAGYRVVRDGTVIATTPTASFADTGLAPGRLYKYRVSAFDAAGNTSARSATLQVTTPSPATPVLTTSTSWSYTDTRVDLRTTWKDPATPPAAPLWKVGRPELGFGDGDETTVLARGGSTSSTAVLTWYFRTAFDVPDPSATSGLALSLVRDDGAVVYVNGVEVLRTNMPAGPVGFTTRASANLTGADERTPVTFTVPPNLLAARTNVVAVELHNVGPLNGDASFLLTGYLAPRSA